MALVKSIKQDPLRPFARLFGMWQLAICLTLYLQPLTRLHGHDVISIQPMPKCPTAVHVL